jgi:hypothetical protein
VICVSLAVGAEDGPFLDDFVRDVRPGKTIEIGDASQ